jgi:hypothetical protein
LLPQPKPDQERGLEALFRDGDEIDWVRLQNGGTVKGSLLSVDGTRIGIDTDAQGGSRMGEMTFDFGKVDAVSIAPLEDPPAPPSGLHVVARLTDGSSLTGRLVELSQDRLLLEHALGKGGQLAVPISKLAQLVVRGGLFVYLSDQSPVSVKQHFPPEYDYEVEIWGYKRDGNVTGGKLRLGGQVYEKGLGVHSYCALTYSLEGAFGEFRATIGLDDSTRYLGEPGFGAVVFQVLVDGEPAKAYPTGIVKRKGDKPSEVVVDVTGKSSITLIAGFDPTSLHVLGRANWADAHLIRKR